MQEGEGCVPGLCESPDGKGAGASQCGPVACGAALVCDAAPARGPVTGRSVSLEAKVCAANAVCEWCSWGEYQGKIDE